MEDLFPPVTIFLAVLMIISVIAYPWKKPLVRSLTLLVSVGTIGFFYGISLAGTGNVQDILFRLSDFLKQVPFYIRIGIMVIPTFFIGSVFCGWICPMGGDAGISSSERKGSSNPL
jgi:hypothetical protein